MKGDPQYLKLAENDITKCIDAENLFQNSAVKILYFLLGIAAALFVV